MRKQAWLFGIMATLAMFVASTGVYPASFGLWHQPKHPARR